MMTLVPNILINAFPIDLVKFNCFFFREPMAIQKGILVHDLLGVVCRALSVNGTSLGSSQLIEVQLLRDLLPSIHSSFISVLNSLIPM
jgi:hypothetical protein